MTPRLIPITSGSKVAAVPWAPYQDRVPTQEETDGWRLAFPGCNWGLLTGRPSGVVVLDVDVRHHGMDAIRDRVIPVTRTVLTWSGGWHYYFRCPEAGCRTVPSILPGCDLKGDGGYVLVPPSAISDTVYELAVDAAVAPIPAWITEAIHRANGAGTQTAWKEALGAVPQGSQDAHLIALAGKLARTLPVELWSTIAASLEAAAHNYPQNGRQPWTKRDFQRLAESACRMEEKRRTSVAVREIPL